ncbi:MAG: DsbC family protein [Deltaproteobacteria bacterium]|jgi:thiol:disulfide interchange protein DsbC
MKIKAGFAMTFLAASWLLTAQPDNAQAFDPAAGAKECASCHTLSNEEAGKLLLVEKFKAEVKEVRPGPIKGVWEVELTQNNKAIIVYVDYGKKYLAEGMRFIEIAKLGENVPPPPKKIDLAKVPLDGAVVLGDAKAEKKVIVFDDPDCPYCKKLDEEIKNILEKRKDIAFYIKMFPLPMHPEAYDKSKAIVCASLNAKGGKGGKGAKLLADAFAGKKLPKATCDTKEVDNNIKLAGELGITGTPGIILPDGRLISGYVPADTLLNLIDTPQQ